MSGRGRNNQGGRYHCGGRSFGRNYGRIGQNTSNHGPKGRNYGKHEETMKFVPHYSRKQQVVTYDTVKEHIIQQIQKTFKYGSDMVRTIQEDTYINDNEDRPQRRLAEMYDTLGDSQEALVVKIEQGGYDLEHTEELRNFSCRRQLYEENQHKAYALIFSYCNKTMQNRIEEAADFEDEIRNDPLRLLEEIKTKMYDPVQAKYEYVLLTKLVN